MSDNRLLTAAIDFGTAFSTWAFSFYHEFKREKTKVNIKHWNSYGNYVSQKAPTCILIHADGETIDSFGYDAIQKYHSLALDDNHGDYYFFQKFKMQLYSQNLDRNLMLKDISGKELPTMKIFSLAIKYLKDDMVKSASQTIIKTDENKTAHDASLETDIKWVITVPAIWDDAAKQFMREAANKADIPNDRLQIALEPEVASVYCRLLPAMNCQGSMSGLKPGHKYLILDAGGGTVDITVHEVGENGSLKEVHRASGGAWGGERVNEEFGNFLQNLFGVEIIEAFKREALEDYMQLMDDFELKKRSGTNDSNDVSLRIPLALSQTLVEQSGKGIKEIVEKSKYSDAITIKTDKMRIKYDLFRSFFEIPITETSTHVAYILDHVDVQGCNTILMVGGFSGSVILQNAIRERFWQKNVVVPTEPELAIIKGAVIFGHDPLVVVQRKLKYTYGTSIVHEKEDSCTHPPTEVNIISGKPHCADIFSAHVHVGDVVKLDEEISGQTYIPCNPLANMTEVSIYKSTKNDPQVVTDESCTLVGTLKLKLTPMLMSLIFGQSSDAIGFSVTFMFGGTEIKVRGEDKMTGRLEEIVFDCLENDEADAAAQK